MNERGKKIKKGKNEQGKGTTNLQNKKFYLKFKKIKKLWGCFSHHDFAKVSTVSRQPLRPHESMCG